MTSPDQPGNRASGSTRSPESSASKCPNPSQDEVKEKRLPVEAWLPAFLLYLLWFLGDPCEPFALLGGLSAGDATELLALLLL